MNEPFDQDHVDARANEGPELHDSQHQRLEDALVSVCELAGLPSYCVLLCLLELAGEMLVLSAVHASPGALNRGEIIDLDEVDSERLLEHWRQLAAIQAEEIVYRLHNIP